ncbi:MAG TPA: tyrosine-type recombinase/integrase [Candidatus Paceibacterota bacterium]|nr:tyrosine-type recombinase/integrase [Candidatus Paceibacterota bacterium]
MSENAIQKYEDLGSDELQKKAEIFFDYLDVSNHTRREYKYRIRMFIDFIGTHGFDRNSFLEFKRFLAGREDLSVATKNKYLATARIFLKELYRLGVVPVEITVNVRSFNQSSKHKREGLNHSEIERLVSRIYHLPSDERNTRLKALFSLLVFQGLRQVEITRLDVKDLDLVAKKAHVQGKGRDDKEPIHLLPETIKALKKYMQVNKIASGALFKSLGNRKSPRISTMTIKRDLKSLFQAEEVEKTVHGLRHYYITTLLEKFDVRDVRKFSRHKSLEMLIVYDDEIELTHKASEVAECFKGLNVA